MPLANVGALLGNPAWLAVYPTLIALALIATSLGLGLSIALFFLLGPRRARLYTQMTGAVIAGAFVLGAQIVAILPHHLRDAIIGWFASASAAHGARRAMPCSCRSMPHWVTGARLSCCSLPGSSSLRLL